MKTRAQYVAQQRRRALQSRTWPCTALSENVRTVWVSIGVIQTLLTFPDGMVHSSKPCIFVWLFCTAWMSALGLACPRYERCVALILSQSFNPPNPPWTIATQTLTLYSFDVPDVRGGSVSLC